jgi:hypothetical protein
MEAVLSRLRNILWGGGVRLPEQLAERARAVGFTGVQVVPALGAPSGPSLPSDPPEQSKPLGRMTPTSGL